MNDIPFEFFQQVDVKTGGFQAEYGRATGGITSVVTRSGSNDLEIGSAVYYTPEDLRAHRPDTTDIFNSNDQSENVETTVWRSEEHTSELQSLMRRSYAVFCLKKKKQ